jgi:hypothetical protein
MATIQQQQDGTLLVTMDQAELDTYSGLPSDQLQEYVTLWLQERATSVFRERFAKLSPQDQGEIMLKIRDAGRG